MPTPLTDAINALTRYANETTGASDTNLSEAVNTLVEGYGQGGGGTNVLTHNWDFTQSLTDTVGEMTAILTNCTQSSSGVYFDQSTSRITFPSKVLKANSRYEIDIASYDRQGTNHGRLLMVSNDQGFAYRSTGYWGAYRNGGGTQFGWQMTTISDPAYFDGHTLKMVIDGNGITTFYRDNDSIMTVNGLLYDGSLTVGGNGNSAYNLTITGMRIYENGQGGGGSSVVLPNGYARLNYIQSTGTQYIDTGLYTKANQAYYIDARRISSSSTTNFMGNNVSGCAMFLQNGSSGTDLYAQFGSANYVRADTGDKYTARQIKVDINGYYKLNVATKEYDLLASFASSSVTENENVHNILFGRTTSNTPQLGELMIFHFWCEEDGVKVRDMYPAMRLSDNELGMYDTVNDVFYTNDGTGSFLSGTTI